jgi:hypothetical protein
MTRPKGPVSGKEMAHPRKLLLLQAILLLLLIFFLPIDRVPQGFSFEL